MEWYEGSIPNAIKTSKLDGKVLVVYISGTDDVSKKMDETWKDKEVSELAKANCVALKIDANSETCKQFSQIYPVMIIPSTYFIGNQGVPLEVVGGHLEVDDFTGKIEHVLKLNSSTKTSEQEKLSSMPNAVASEDGAQASDLERAERVRKAEEMIEMRRRQKAEEASQKELNDEMQRRKLGKDAIKLKQWQEDKEREEIASNWKKEREEDRLHKEKIKQQIAQDRAERQARFAKEKEDRDQEKVRTMEAKQVVNQQQSQEQRAARMESARLQFRLPDGSSVTETFASSETLGTARALLVSRIGNIYGNFSMSTTFPRREFKEEDMNKSLLELDLAPSAAVIIVPAGRGTSITVSNGGGGSFIMLLLSPFLFLWNFIYNLLFGAPRAVQNPSSTSPTRFQQSQNTRVNQQQSTSSQTSYADKLTAFQNRGQRLQGATTRTEGNIHRLRNVQDDEDNSTYNGNSTQQM